MENIRIFVDGKEIFPEDDPKISILKNGVWYDENGNVRDVQSPLPNKKPQKSTEAA